MIENKVKALNRLYSQVDRHVSAYKRRSGLKCTPGCGACCLKRDLKVTLLEFLPAAYHLYVKGESFTILDKIMKKDDPLCVFYDPFAAGGNCSNYQYRGLICRMFGFSTKVDKYGTKSLVSCSRIKLTINKDNQEQVLVHAPNYSSYYLRMYGIDPNHSISYLHINQAIKEAIEMVLFYSGSRKKHA